jgi:DNA-binding GntR family transcriptional regulator
VTRAVDKVYAHIREGIFDGKYRPGARLGEVEIADVTGASRTPVREALRQLEMEGLVEVLPHRGARVYDWTVDDVEEIYDLRMVLEAMAASRAAERIGTEDLTRLAELCNLMDTALADEHVELIAQYNDEFHEIVRIAAASSRLTTMLGNVIQVALVMRTFQRYDPDELSRSFAHHRDLVAALRAHDSLWAESVMRAHVRAAKAVLVRELSAEAG